MMLGTTNIKLAADVNEWGVSNEDSLSDHNYLQYKIRKGAGTQNKTIQTRAPNLL